MDEIVIEQAFFHRPDRQRPTLLARSPGFHEEWQLEAEKLIAGFGERPAGTRCPLAIFAYPMGADQVAVVRVADRPGDRPEQDGASFHFHVLPRQAYTTLFGDPFELAKRLPVTWEGRDSLAPCRLPAEPLPPRTVDDVRRVLQRLKRPLDENGEPGEESTPSIDNAESPALLGGVQALVDGGRVVFERPAADTGLVPDLWTLLPNSTRCQLWPASFAFGNTLGFDALVVARAFGAEYNGYTTEDQAAEYPEGQYELNLQIAAEAGDQHRLDLLFQRRSWLETWRLALILLLAFLFLALAARVLL